MYMNLFEKTNTESSQSSLTSNYQISIVPIQVIFQELFVYNGNGLVKECTSWSLTVSRSVT